MKYDLLHLRNIILSSYSAGLLKWNINRLHYGDELFLPISQWYLYCPSLFTGCLGRLQPFHDASFDILIGRFKLVKMWREQWRRRFCMITHELIHVTYISTLLTFVCSSWSSPSVWLYSYLYVFTCTLSGVQSVTFHWVEVYITEADMV